MKNNIISVFCFMYNKKNKIVLLIVFVIICVYIYIIKNRDPSKIYNQFQENIVLITNTNITSDTDYGQIDIWCGTIINQKGCIITCCHTLKNNTIGGELSVIYVDENDQYIPYQYVIDRMDIEREYAILKPVYHFPKLEAYPQIASNYNFEVGNEISIISVLYNRFDQGVKNLKYVKCLIPQTILSTLEQDTKYASNGIVMLGMSGSPVFNKNGEIIGIVFGVNSRQVKFSDSYISLNTPDGNVFKYPFTTSLFRYTIFFKIDKSIMKNIDKIQEGTPPF